MRLMQRLAISGLLSVILILLFTGTFITGRRDLASVVDRGVAPEERSEQLNPAWVQDNVVPGQDEPEIENKDKDKDRRLDNRHKQFEPSVVEAPAASDPGIYVIRPPNPPLDDITNQRREKVKEMMKHGWDNYVRYAWGKNELRPISKRGHSASIFGASNMGATIVDGLDTLYIMGLHDEFKQGRDWIAENLDFDIFTIFVTTECDMEFIITELTYIFPTIIHVLSYNCFYFNSKIIKQLLEHIKLDWKTMKDNELKIIEKYTFNCYMFALYINILAGLGMLIFTIIEFIPVILDAIAPLNESRPRKLKVSYELFIDEEEYYFLYLLFEVLTVTVGIWSTITTGTFFIIIGGHCCATLKIASNLIQKAVTKNLLQLPAPHRIYFMYQNICRAVHIHRRTIKLISI